MSTYTPYTWPVIDTAAVCALQDTSGASQLSFTGGTLYNSDLPNQISFISNNFIRSVSITSANNLSGVTFTVTGFQNEAFVTETITGPNNDTVYGTKYYDLITSVIVNAAVTQVSIGTGDKGYLPLIQLNTLSSSINYSCSVYLPTTPSITYSLFQTLEQVTTNYIAFQNQEGTNFFPISSNQTTSQILNFTTITNYLLMKIVSTTAPTTNTLKFIYLQL
jgi:hypothetical protein